MCKQRQVYSLNTVRGNFVFNDVEAFPPKEEHITIPKIFNFSAQNRF